jgi:transmembrane sensor
VTRHRDLDPELVARFLSGESTLAESVLVRAWAADPLHRAEFEAIQRAWSHSFPLERPIDVDAAWRNLSKAMHPESQEIDSGVDSTRTDAVSARGNLRLYGSADSVRIQRSRFRIPTLGRVSRRSSSTRMAAMAAAAALLVATSLSLVSGTWPLGSLLQHSAQAPVRKTQNFVARAGQRALIDLADGTHIVLAPESRLAVSLPTGASGLRELTLDGEALFTVVHDTARPFVVHSRYGTTVDVGTSFAVRAYRSEPYRVVVRDGQVALGAEPGARLLETGDVASGGADGTMHVAHDPAAASLIDWTTGRLTFQHRRFADVVPELERWYGVTIRIASPSLRDRRITGQLDTESRAEAMAAIGRTLGARYETHDTHVTFSIAGEGR